MTDSYIALDLETTGLEPKKKNNGDRSSESRAWTDHRPFRNSGKSKRPLTERVVELTGITDDMLKDAPVIEDIIGEVLEFIGNLPLLGHNIRFDYSFLKQAAVNQKMEFECEAVDTLKVCRKLMPEQEKKIWEMPVPIIRSNSPWRTGQRPMHYPPISCIRSWLPFMEKNSRNSL